MKIVLVILSGVLIASATPKPDSEISDRIQAVQQNMGVLEGTFNRNDNKSPENPVLAKLCSSNLGITLDEAVPELVTRVSSDIFISSSGRIYFEGKSGVLVLLLKKTTFVGSTQILHDVNGRLSYIGTTQILHDVDGRVNYIGATQILHDTNGRVNYIGATQIFYSVN